MSANAEDRSCAGTTHRIRDGAARKGRRYDHRPCYKVARDLQAPRQLARQAYLVAHTFLYLGEAVMYAQWYRPPEVGYAEDSSASE